MTSHEPLSPELLDKLLSAELDGELEAAARDLGLDPHEVAARIAATPGAESRRHALAEGSASLAVEPLDDLTRRRLLGALRGERELADALPTSRGRTSATRSQQWQRVLAVAAAVLVVVGAASVIVSLGGEDGSDDTAADAPESVQDALGGDHDVRNYKRDVGDPANLEQILRAPVGAASEDDGAPLSGSTSVPAEIGSGEPAPSDAGQFTLRSSDVETCLARFATEFADAPVDRLYSAPHDGRPALVVVTDLDGTKSVIVYDPATCETLEFQSLPGS